MIPDNIMLWRYIHLPEDINWCSRTIYGNSYRPTALTDKREHYTCLRVDWIAAEYIISIYLNATVLFSNVLSVLCFYWIFLPKSYTLILINESSHNKNVKGVAQLIRNNSLFLARYLARCKESEQCARLSLRYRESIFSHFLPVSDSFSNFRCRYRGGAESAP